MPDRRSPTPEQRSEALVRDAAAQAASLVQAGSEEAQAKAIARALRDERVDRDLRDHERRLAAINGSQQQTAAALAQVNATLAEQAELHRRQAAVSEALSKHLEDRARWSLSRWQKIGGALAVLAAWGTIIASVLTQ